MAEKKYIYIKELKIKIEVSEMMHKEHCHFNDYEKNLRKKDKKNGLMLYSSLDNKRLLGEEMVADRNLLSIEEQVEMKLLVERLRECLDTLPDEERALIQALYYDNLSERELSKKTGLHHMTIHNKKVVILEKMKKLMGK